MSQEGLDVMVDSVSSGGTQQGFTADELIQRAREAASNNGKHSGDLSAVAKMLAGKEEGDTVSLSPVARALAAKSADAAKTSTPFTEQDWYIKAKVSQLRGQLETFSTIPGLDPSGSIIDSISKEINDLIGKQQAKLRKSKAEQAEKQKILDDAKAKEYKGVSADDMLKNAKDAANGVKPKMVISKEAQALLDKVKKGSSVNTTA